MTLFCPIWDIFWQFISTKMKLKHFPTAVTATQRYHFLGENAQFGWTVCCKKLHFDKFRLLENRITYCKIVRKTSFRLEQPLSNSTDCRTPITFLGENARFYSLRFLVKQPFCTKLHIEKNLSDVIDSSFRLNIDPTQSITALLFSRLIYFLGKCTMLQILRF